MSIPVENIYYLLCYAWNKLDEGKLVDVSGIDSGRVADLLAKVLINGTSRLLRRGLDRDYEERIEDLSMIRGRVLFGDSVKRGLFRKARASCLYDELQYDVLHNQILKATIRRLISTPNMDNELRKQLTGLSRRMPDVSDIQLSRQMFSRLQLHRNNAFYVFLMHVCELVMESTLIDETSGGYRFRDFLRDEKKMAKLFQWFVFNFYKLEQSEYETKSEIIKWDAATLFDDRQNDIEYLPQMETDISLRSPLRTLVIDTKYYEDTLVSKREGAKKIHANNLYQLHAYLANLEKSDGPDACAEGMLLYPDTSGEVDLAYRIKGHAVMIRTINLDQPWKQIHNDLLGLLVVRAS